MSEWLIGYKIEDKTLGEMIVEVDQCAPREHYLYLYNEEEQEPVEVEDDVAVIESESLAKVLGVLPPGSWSYAINVEVIKSFEVSENGEDVAVSWANEEED